MEPKDQLENIGQNKFLLELRKERGVVDNSVRSWVIAISIGLGVIGLVILSIIVTM